MEKCRPRTETAPARGVPYSGTGPASASAPRPSPPVESSSLAGDGPSSAGVYARSADSVFHLKHYEELENQGQLVAADIEDEVAHGMPKIPAACACKKARCRSVSALVGGDSWCAATHSLRTTPPVSGRDYRTAAEVRSFWGCFNYCVPEAHPVARRAHQLCWSFVSSGGGTGTEKQHFALHGGYMTTKRKWSATK